MERFSVTAEELRGRFGGSAVLGDVFGAIERELQITQQVVCQYIINGMALDEKDEPRFKAVTVDQVQKFEYLSESSERLLEGVIAEWISALPAMQEGCENLALRLKAGATTGVLKSMHDLIENCEFLMESLHSAGQLMGDAHAVAVQGVDQIEVETVQAIREAVRHLEGQDFVQLGLVIEYDLNHVLEQWSGLLKSLSQRLTGREEEDVDGTARRLDRRRGSN